MTIKNLVQHFGTVEDPRCRGKILHRLEEILVIAVCAVIACADSWDDIALYGRSKLPWLKTFLELPNGIPSHDTFRRVSMTLGSPATCVLSQRHAACRTRARRRLKPARPYMVRFSIFSLLIWPSAGLVVQGRSSAA